MTTPNEFPEELKDLSMEDARGWVLDMTVWGSAVIKLAESGKPHWVPLNEFRGKTTENGDDDS